MTKIIDDVKLDYSDVLLVPKRSKLNSRADVETERTVRSPHTGRELTSNGIIAANMDTVGTFAMASALMQHNSLTALHKFYRPEEIIDWFDDARESAKLDVFDGRMKRERTFVSIGTSEADWDKLHLLHHALDEDAREEIIICIDVANGYTPALKDTVIATRKLFPYSVIMAGNVVTPDLTYDLIYAGADIVKVGIGPGSVCTTRKMTGVGYPQLSAVMECAEAAHAARGFICADGGITEPGAVAKAFAAGADFVMLGGMLAGHKECGGDVVTVDGLDIDEDQLTDEPKDDWRMRFYGMSSGVAMTKHYGGVASYRASEGKEVLLPYRGSVENTMIEILGGVRSACTYVGASSIKNLPKCATFVKVNRVLNNSLSQYDV